MSTSSFVIPVFLFSLLSMAVSDLYKGDACKTREGAAGVCLPVQECPSTVMSLRAKMWPTKCGFEGHTPVVCCVDEPAGTTTPGPERKAALVAEKDGKSDVPILKAAGETDVIDEGSKRKPGDVATYWCAQYREKCIRHSPQRFKRAVEGNNFPDYEDFGTSEKPLPEEYDEPTIPHTGIVGGEMSFRNEFPHMAAVGFGKQSDIRWECGGSLISYTFVLTAAHCLMARDGSRAQWVLLGTQYVSDKLRGYSVSRRGVIYHVIRRIRHPEYKKNAKYNDLALLELGPSLQYDKSFILDIIQPACLQVEWSSQIQKATASGWGRLGHGENPSSFLQKVDIHILDNSICNETYTVEMKLSKLSNGVDETMICAGDLKGGKDTCQGDSGGPLQQRTDSCLTHIIGVTSFGKVCGFADSPAVYMRVSHFVPWIESVVWPEGKTPTEN